jgi:2-hydroxychromene-2-carboxylate isomerase
VREPVVEFYFFLGSTHTHLAVHRAAAAAQRAGVRLEWRPFSVRTLMREQNNSPFVGKPAKLRYMWRDIERRAARLHVPFTGPAPYPIDPQELANHVATLAALEGWCPAFVQAAYEAWFLGKQDPGQPEVLRAVLARIGQDAEAVIAQAQTPAVHEAYVARTNQARELGIFGSPTFVVGREIFWGDDRLEEALEWAHTPWVEPSA